MSEQIEIEFKTLLSEREFSEVMTHFKIDSTQFFTQINYYFDTKDFQLKNRQMGLRIRTFTSKAEMTLKIPHDTGLLEITDVLTLDDAKNMIDYSIFPKKSHVLVKLINLGITVQQLHLIGDLKTNRAEIDLPEGLLALDENWYNKHHDFELELEVADAFTGKQAFSALLNILNIKENFAGNKIQRMMKSLEKQNH